MRRSSAAPRTSPTPPPTVCEPPRWPSPSRRTTTARDWRASCSRPRHASPAATRMLVVGALAAHVGFAEAQDIEPRAYSNAPVGVNFLVAGYAYSHGGLSLDPSIPLTDARLRTSAVVLAYARTLDLWGVS